ncbi:SDR family oxidoreductase [Caballeronia sp. GACF5]|uniref:SDR family oxidoreductase n=1 Tax=Caballeronia sp. GACF5 TaxID=2921746 RepID=UPI0020279E41|nr:SDR family oxidoreductase [Caballeronia sp. GACF5]
MDLGINDLRVLVTAGADGIGRAVTEAFLREGARVFVCDTNQLALGAIASDHPRIGTIACDVSQEASVAAMIDAAVKFLGGLDCLVNNAGTAGPTAPTVDVTAPDWAMCIDVNLSGTFYCTRRALPHLRMSRNASITNLSSAAGRMGYPNKSPYSAAKWGVVGFTKSVSIEYGADGIRCNAVLPGPVDNARMREVIKEKAQLSGISSEDQAHKYLSRASLKSFVKPEEVADLIVFLGSERARCISGQAVGIDGDLQALV